MEDKKENLDQENSQRLDKWLNYSCLFKTRAQATRACDERKIKVNEQVAKPSRMIKPGDEITIKQKAGNYIKLEILKVSHKNIPLKDARELYKKHEIEISEESRELLEMYKESEKSMKVKYKGRPTKKERRKMEKLKGNYYPWS